MIVKRPVAAPVGTTKPREVLVALETGAPMVPPPCRLRVTRGAAPLAKPSPVALITDPADAVFGVKLEIVRPTMVNRSLVTEAVLPARSIVVPETV